MELVRGFPLSTCPIEKIKPRAKNLMDQCLDIAVNLIKNGIVHGDLNEFNLMLEDVDEDGKEHEIPKIFMIDFPQMVSTDHSEAKDMFYRDVSGITTFFGNKFDLVCEELPDFDQLIEEQKLAEKQLEEEELNNLSWKMNLMESARKIGNETQGGWAPLPQQNREDENGGSEEFSSEPEEVSDEEPENEDEIQDQIAPLPPKSDTTETTQRLASIRNAMSQISGSTSMPPDQIKLKVKKAMELSKYRANSHKLRKSDKVSTKKRNEAKKDIAKTLQGGPLV